MTKINFAKRMDLIPCRVFDANNVEYENVKRCDTETGRVEQYRLDASGGFVVEEEHAAVDTIDAPPPLRIGAW